MLTNELCPTRAQKMTKDESDDEDVVELTR